MRVSHGLRRKITVGNDQSVAVPHFCQNLQKFRRNIERFAFYEEAKTAYAIIATGESALYANVMLQKGVVTD